MHKVDNSELRTRYRSIIPYFQEISLKYLLSAKHVDECQYHASICLQEYSALEYYLTLEVNHFYFKKQRAFTSV